MKFFELNEDLLNKVNGGCGASIGMSTPLGEYSAEELIALYNAHPAEAVSFINLAKAFRPDLINDFINECEMKQLTIPEDMMALLK